ncbi:hypothetical protein HPG69_006338 [Diceros bicornis minor]|uniref:Methyltransferase type 11 domain-containing protein n=1 Tax=Diceros bicornis minor TaxID=77932 RepID=A0A7J7FM96_DICBM|nr:hypothetical protein HPG69_006338 [Diceros bicornis minor]
MAQEEAGSLPEVRARVGASHGITDLAHKLRFYDRWASDYDQLQARGFVQLHGVDGSPSMLEQAQARGLYQRLSLCTLRQEPLPSSEGTFDAVLVVGALSDGQVPCSAIAELLRVTKPHMSTKGTTFPGQGGPGTWLLPRPHSPVPPHASPGGMVCLTTRANPSNLRYKEALEATLDRLEQAGAWERLVAWPVDQWELATSELELVPGTSDSDGFISGIIYLYQKQKATQSRE